MASVQTRCGSPDFKAVYLRKVPGTSVEIFTPRDTYLYVYPGVYGEPKLSWGTPPASYVKIGMWGNSPLYTDKGYSVKDLSAELRAIIQNGGEPPQPIDISKIMGKSKDALVTFDYPSLVKVALTTPNNGLITFVKPGPQKGAFPPSGNKPPTQGGTPSQESGSGASGGMTAQASEGPGIGTVLVVTAVVVAGVYAISRGR